MWLQQPGVHDAGHRPAVAVHERTEQQRHDLVGVVVTHLRPHYADVSYITATVRDIDWGIFWGIVDDHG